MTIIKVCGENIWPMYQILEKVLLKQIERNETKLINYSVTSTWQVLLASPL